ncbi:MAG TPA: hypothetical protein VGZ73_13020 [Bryobacteraceae bacterium]|nr:hypothetical protein [Bryobacteraceae bacterium]
MRIGVPAAAAVTRVLQPYLYGVGARDPVTFVVILQEWRWPTPRDALASAIPFGIARSVLAAVGLTLGRRRA